MMAVHRPTTIEALCEVVQTAAAGGTTLAIRGGGSKSAIGAPIGGADTLDMTAFSGLIDYVPADLVLVAGAGTPLAKIEGLVADHGQMLAFEPFDPAPLFGEPAGRATIGGVIAAGLSGPRRLSAGGARDHLLGFEAVSGRGEAMSGGARVVKNVTGYDLPKLIAGSWGRLAALTSVTLKTLPRPRATATWKLSTGWAGRGCVQTLPWSKLVFPESVSTTIWSPWSFTRARSSTHPVEFRR